MLNCKRKRCEVENHPYEVCMKHVEYTIFENPNKYFAKTEKDLKFFFMLRLVAFSTISTSKTNIFLQRGLIIF